MRSGVHRPSAPISIRSRESERAPRTRRSVVTATVSATSRTPRADRRAIPLVRQAIQADGNGCILRERAHGCADAAVGEDRREDAVREFPQFFDRGAQVRIRGRQPFDGLRVRVRRELRAQEPERKREADQTLLCAIVQVVFQALPSTSPASTMRGATRATSGANFARRRRPSKPRGDRDPSTSCRHRGAGLRDDQPSPAADSVAPSSARARVGPAGRPARRTLAGIREPSAGSRRVQGHAQASRRRRLRELDHELLPLRGCGAPGPNPGDAQREGDECDRFMRHSRRWRSSCQRVPWPSDDAKSAATSAR